MHDDDSVSTSPPRERSVTGWTTLAGVLMAVAVLLVAGFVGYRHYAIHEFVAAMDADDSGGIVTWGLRLDRIGMLEDGLRASMEQSAHSPWFLSPGDGDFEAKFVRALARLVDDDESRDVRFRAVEYLAFAETMDLDPALPTLERAASEEPDPEVRLCALVAYGNARPNTPAPPFLLEALRSPEPVVRLGALQALGQVEPGRVPEAMPLLFELLRSTDPEVVGLALNYVPIRGWDPRTRLPDLLALLESPDASVRERTVQILLLLAAPQFAPAGPRPLTPEEILEPLCRLIRERDAVAESAIQAIGQLGEAARPALPDLVKALDDEHLRDDAAQALLGIDREAAIAAGIDPKEYGAEGVLVPSY